MPAARALQDHVPRTHRILDSLAAQGHSVILARVTADLRVELAGLHDHGRLASSGGRGQNALQCCIEVRSPRRHVHLRLMRRGAAARRVVTVSAESELIQHRAHQLGVSIHARRSTRSLQDGHSEVVPVDESSESVAALGRARIAIEHVHRYKDEQLLRVRVKQEVEDSAADLLGSSGLDFNGYGPGHSAVHPRGMPSTIVDLKRGTTICKGCASRRPENLFAVRIVRAHCTPLRLTLRQPTEDTVTGSAPAPPSGLPCKPRRQPAGLDRKSTRANTSRGLAGGAASGAPHGAERTASPTRAASESQIT
jgi:hypothetical protein